MSSPSSGRRRSVSATVMTGKQLAQSSSPSPSSAKKQQFRQAVLEALKDVHIKGVTVDNDAYFIQDIKNNTSISDFTKISSSANFGSHQGSFSSFSSSPSPTRGGTVGGRNKLHSAIQNSNLLNAIMASATPVGSEEVRELTDEDHRLLGELDQKEVAPLLAFLKSNAPELYEEMPARFTPDIAEEIIHRLISGDDVSGSRQRKRGMTSSRWSAVRGLAHGVGGLVNTELHEQLQHSASAVILAPEDTNDNYNYNNNNEHDFDYHNNNNSHSSMMKRTPSFLMNQSNASSILGDSNNNMSRPRSATSSSTSRNILNSNSTNSQHHHHHHSGDDGTMLFHNIDDDLVEAQERERKMQSVLNGVQRVSERHRERTMKLRMANRDIADVAVQTVSTQGVKVVTTTGRPPPSHAVDAVGGIKQQMKTTHGEPPLMVLRQELEDRQALAAAMPRIRARVAEIMGKLSKEQNPMSKNNRSSSSRPGSAASNYNNSSKQRSRPGSSSAQKRTPNAHVGNFFSPNAPTSASKKASGAPSMMKDNKRPSSASNNTPNKNVSKGTRTDRDISEIAKRLRLRSESLNTATEQQHKEAVEKRRAASQLRRELVQQGLWVDVRILSMFRPPSQVKAFVSSWAEFKQMVVQAVAPLPPGCSFASLSYISGPGAKSVIDPRHPLLRPLRGFEVVRNCKSRDGTSANLTVSVAIRSSAETAGLPQDFEI